MDTLATISQLVTVARGEVTLANADGKLSFAEVLAITAKLSPQVMGVLSLVTNLTGDQKKQLHDDAIREIVRFGLGQIDTLVHDAVLWASNFLPPPLRLAVRAILLVDWLFAATFGDDYHRKLVNVVIDYSPRITEALYQGLKAQFFNRKDVA